MAVCWLFASGMKILDWLGELIGQLVSALTTVALFCGVLVGIYSVLDWCHLPALSIMVLGMAFTGGCLLTLGFWKPQKLEQLL